MDDFRCHSKWRKSRAYLALCVHLFDPLLEETMPLHRFAKRTLPVAVRRAVLFGAALLLAAAAPVNAQGALDNLARDVDRTESLRAVLDLQRTYAHYAQAGLWREVGALFATDGSLLFDGLVMPEQAIKGTHRDHQLPAQALRRWP